MRFNNVALETPVEALPDEIWTSSYLEEKLAPLYGRLKLPMGRLELMTGIRERRFFAPGTPPSAAAARASARLLGEYPGHPSEEIDLLIHSAVCRDRLEPATASYVHRLLELPARTQILDVSNACLGFLNAVVLAAGLIEAGQIKRALVVAGENGRPLVENTVNRLNEDTSLTRRTIKPYFANLTIGAGAVAAIVCHRSLASARALSLLGGAGETDTAANELCQGDGAAVEVGGLDMQTDSEALLEAGIAVAQRCWRSFEREISWSVETPDTVVTHQVGKQHRNALYAGLGLDPAKDFPTFETLGNIGSVSCPLTLGRAVAAGRLPTGKRVAILGIGSGLSALMLALEAL
jgi:3-oxoacyl-[acyl-carrier-protein] synthase-3